MKNRKSFMIVMILITMISLVACSTPVGKGRSPEKSTGQIYLYGECYGFGGIEETLKKELELWGEYYHQENMRHLFIQLPYYSGEFLNLWMESANDDILEELYREWEGIKSQKLCVKEFYKKIKNKYPETVFHGTDVGRQYHTTGPRFLKYLEENNLENTEKYTLAQESIEQGKYYDMHSDDGYRENKMVENFIREFDKLKDENIMGIYEESHTDVDAMTYGPHSVPCMANQLKKYYGEAINSENLDLVEKDIEPLRVDTITVDGKDYDATYFGEQDLIGAKDYAFREFWRLEDAYWWFQNNKKTGDVLPYIEFPMKIETGQVFVIDTTKTDGSVERIYFRSDGYIFNGMPSTEEFIIE